MSKSSKIKIQKSIPKILLIGVGRFGQNHLQTLQTLEKEGQLDLFGVVVRNKNNAKKIEDHFHVRTYPKISAALLKMVDAVDIVTPPETHFKLVKECIKYTNIFVEKPLAEKTSESIRLAKLSKKYNHIIMVGHIFRHNLLTEKLKELIGNKSMPQKLRGSFINPLSADQGREPSLEMMHFFDIIDYLWDVVPISIHSISQERLSIIDIRYGKNTDTHLTLGWDGNKKHRFLKFIYLDRTIEADFIANTIVIAKDGIEDILQFSAFHEPLRAELVTFISALSDKKINKDRKHVDASSAIKIVSIAEKAISKNQKFPRVAIIGAGIFGISVANELGKTCKVTLFEKNSRIMHEGSRINQFRHHYGYHYPRSDATVADVQNSRADFEEIFSKAIMNDTPTYYGLAKKGSLVSAEEFLVFCKKHRLAFKKQFPSDGLLAKEEISLCVRVPEPNYHFDTLLKIAHDRLKSRNNVTMRLGTEVMNCVLEEAGNKKISYAQTTRKGKKRKTESFDYVINATYANINKLTGWMNFVHHPIRVDLAEVLIVYLPIDPVSITVIDGPFATLMPTGNPNEFTLYHVKESILGRYVPKDGLIKKLNKKISSKEKSIYNESLKLFPILKHAKIIESRIVHRGVQANHEHDDARIADLITHGFGCWSILSGKILSSVTMAKRLGRIINKKGNK